MHLFADEAVRHKRGGVRFPGSRAWTVHVGEVNAILGELVKREFCTNVHCFAVSWTETLVPHGHLFTYTYLLSHISVFLEFHISVFSVAGIG